MSVTFTAFATTADNELGAAEGLSIFRQDTEDGILRDSAEIASATAAISDEDGDLDTGLAEAKLADMGWLPAGAGWVPSGGQYAIEVEKAG